MEETVDIKNDITNWKISFHDANLKLFQIQCFPELYFSYIVVSDKKKLYPIIFEQEIDGEGCYIRLLEEDSFYQNVQHILNYFFEK